MTEVNTATEQAVTQPTVKANAAKAVAEKAKKVPAANTAKWYVIDASDLILGRLSAYVASHLLNKHKADYIPYGLEGDKYVIVNAEKVTMTGNKMKDSINYYHTGFPGGIRGKSKGAILESSTPEKVLISSIKRMMPRGPRGRHLLKNLMVYKGDSHPHSAQQPEVIDFLSFHKANQPRGGKDTSS
jgi:large subunit ribosomal protein L13